MYRRLLAVFICLSLLLASGNITFAWKDPGQIRVLPGTLPGAPKAGAQFNVAVPEMPPQYSKPYSAALRADVTGVPYRNPSDCTPISYWDGTPYWYWPIPDDYGDDFFNMRFTPADDVDCRLATVALCFYDVGSTVITGSGIDIILWEDDGYGFPGTELARINVPAADMIWFPWYVVVDFTPFDFHFANQDFHIGFTTVDQANDVYAVLSDEGVLGTLRSSEYYLGLWGTMYNDWGLDVNFIIEADVCYSGPIPTSNCSRLEYGAFAAYYYWIIPDQYGDDFFNERFTNVDPTLPGTLGAVYLNMHPDASVDMTGEGIDVIVWDDDGAGFPGTELARVNVPTAQMVWYPYELEVDMRPYGLRFAAGEDFHIGYTTVNQGAGNVMAILSDDGFGPAEYRSSESWGGIWGLMIDDWGVDVDFLIAAELCFGDPMPPPVCWWEWYNGDAEYFWTLPDVYGDDYFNMRFTNSYPIGFCTLAALEIAFYADGSVGSPGADFILFNSDGTYPTDTIAVYSVSPVTTWFPGYEHVDCSVDNIVIAGDYHLGYSPIYNDPDDVLACLSDDGSMGTLRSSECWSGIWGLMIDDWGTDVNFLMRVNICCLLYEPPTCQPDGEWPTLSHDFARTGYNPVEVGDLCGFQRIWHYWSPYDFCYFANPIIAGEKVYATFGVHLECLDVYTGASIWSTLTIPAYSNILGGQIRTTPTYEDDGRGQYVYFSGGTFESVIKADANTGAIIWSRGGITGPALEGTPGSMRFCPTVIIGDALYVGGDGGTIYKLDKNTGATLAFVGTPYGNSVWVSPSTDGTNLYIGCAIGWTGGDAGVTGVQGGLYKYDGNLVLIGPYTGNQGWDEGVTSGATYAVEEDALYFMVAHAQPPSEHAGTDGFTQKADASTMGPHADNSYVFSGCAQYSNPAIDPRYQYVFFGNVPNRDYRFEGIWCNTFGFNTVWQDFTKGAMTGPAGVSCDYVFWGSRQHPYGRFNCNTPNGAEQFSYILTGYGFGPAIAKYETDPGVFQVFVAQTQLWSDCGTGGGRLAMYSVGGPRGRLQIPSNEVVIDPVIDFIDPDGTERTAELFCNDGCAGLKYCLQLEAHSAYPTRTFTSNVDPHRMARIEKEADRLIEYSIDDFGGRREWKQASMRHTPMKSEIGDRPAGIKSKDISAASAPPSWVTLLSPDEGMIRVVDCYEATFAFAVSAMNRGQNLFYVTIATDDPDYNECDLYGSMTCGHNLPINTSVLVNAVKGFAFCDGYLDFGDGGDDYEYVNNGGWFDDGTVPDAFTVDGTNDPLYQGTFYYMLDSNRIAWLEGFSWTDFNHFQPDTICTLLEGQLLCEIYSEDGSSEGVYGDYFETAVIDSIISRDTYEFDNSLTIGMRLSYREYGAFGSMFNNFKLIAYDLYNRNDTQVEDLYWGIFADWDMPGDPNGYEQVEGSIENNIVYQFNEVSGEIAGYGSLPMKGSSLDGTTMTSALYNGYGVDGTWFWLLDLPEMFYMHVDACPEGDWCYDYGAAPGSPLDDRAMILTAGKKTLGAYEGVSGAFVVWYYPTGASVSEIADMMKFANKWAGYDRGDLNNDGDITLNDLVILILYLNGGKAPYPFLYLADVDADGDVDYDDAVYFYDFFFEHGPYPMSKLIR